MDQTAGTLEAARPQSPLPASLKGRSAAVSPPSATCTTVSRSTSATSGSAATWRISSGVPEKATALTSQKLFTGPSTMSATRPGSCPPALERLDESGGAAGVAGVGDLVGEGGDDGDLMARRGRGDAGVEGGGDRGAGAGYAGGESQDEAEGGQGRRATASLPAPSG